MFAQPETISLIGKTKNVVETCPRCTPSVDHVQTKCGPSVDKVQLSRQGLQGLCSHVHSGAHTVASSKCIAHVVSCQTNEVRTFATKLALGCLLPNATLALCGACGSARQQEL